jgi:sulfatase modifying factor 1
MSIRKWVVGMAVFAAVVLVGTALLTGTSQAEIIKHGSTTIDMDFVTVGNAGNTADDTGFGAVGYNYQIGKYEVTADQWAAVIAADPSVGNPGFWSGSQPTAGTTWDEAAKFCNWLTTGSANSGYYTISGGAATLNALGHDAYAALYGTTYFLPTDNEWYKAAYHKNNGVTGGVDNYWQYPTGSDNVPDGIDFDGDTAFDAVCYDGHNQDGYSQGRPNDVTNAGVPSPYGTIGQGGNVWEWNERFMSSCRGLRGGLWASLASDYLAANRYGDFASSGDREIFDTGFRVASSAAVPEPSSLVMWTGLAGTGAFIAWRRRKRAA